MNSNLSITPYRPSFTALTKINNPSKILSDADVKTLKSLGEKIGDSKNAAITMTFEPMANHSDQAFIISYVERFMQGKDIGRYSSRKLTAFYMKNSPLEYGKKLMATFAQDYKAFKAKK